MGFFSFHVQSDMYSSQCKLSNISKRKRDKEGWGGVGEIGETHSFNKNSRFFAEDISNHPLGVYKVNNSFREKVVLFDENDSVRIS